MSNMSEPYDSRPHSMLHIAHDDILILGGAEMHTGLVVGDDGRQVAATTTMLLHLLTGRGTDAGKLQVLLSPEAVAGLSRHLISALDTHRKMARDGVVEP